MTLLSRTKEMAKLRGLSLEEVALKAGLSAKAIYNWGRNSPKAENLDKVADVLHVSTDYLLARTSEPHDDSLFPEDTDAQAFFRIDLSDIPEKDRPKIKKQMEQFKQILLEDM